MPTLHQNTFAGRALSGSTGGGGANALPHTS